ncbi:MAG: hypothetical protein ACREMW_12125 [Gemmatimonadales bacterium]
MTTSPPTPARASLRRDLLVAGVLIGGSAAVGLLTPERLSFELAQRLFGILMGVFVVCYANAAPKTLRPLARLRDPVAEQALRRFTGWSITLGGAGYTLAWIFPPVDVARPLAPGLLGAALLLVLVRAALCRAPGSRA